MVSGISFGSMFNPERSIHPRHVEGKLINPEDNLERLNAHQSSRFGKLSPEEIEEYKSAIDADKPLSKSSSGMTYPASYYIGHSGVNKNSCGTFGKDADVTKLFTQKEIRKILKEVNAPLDGGLSPIGVSLGDSDKTEYSIGIYDGIGIVINNETTTNDTTVIRKDGSVINNGSWHHRELASKGEYTDLYERLSKEIEKRRDAAND